MDLGVVQFETGRMRLYGFMRALALANSRAKTPWGRHDAGGSNPSHQRSCLKQHINFRMLCTLLTTTNSSWKRKERKFLSLRHSKGRRQKMVASSSSGSSQGTSSMEDSCSVLKIGFWGIVYHSTCCFSPYIRPECISQEATQTGSGLVVRSDLLTNNKQFYN